MQQVQDAVKALDGRDFLAEVQAEQKPIDRARLVAEFLAPADMLMLAAISLGTDTEELEANKVAFRLKAEIALRRLAVVGLKSGDSGPLDISDRMRTFLERFHAEAPARAARALPLPAADIDAEPTT